jgi:MFS family permease
MRRLAGAGDKGGRRDLSLYWWGQTTSAFGSVFTAIAMPVIAVVYFDASPGQISLISAASVLPILLFGLPAGALADRIARPRRTLMALDALSAVTVGVVALGVANDVASIGWLIVLGAVDGCATILMEVVYFVHLRQLTDADGIGRVRARLQAGQYGAGFAGRLLVGPAIVVLGPAAALSVDAVSYVLSLTALLSMGRVAPITRQSPREAVTSAGSVLRGMGAGLRFFLGDSFHRALLVFLLVPGAVAAGTAALTAPFLLRVVKVPTEVYGLFFAASGLMGLAGSVLAGRLLRPGRDPRQVTLASFTASTVCGLLLPLAGGPLPVAAACAALGIGLPIFLGAVANVALSPVIVADVSEDAMGRTVAMLQVCVAASGLLGALAAGVLGDWIGVRQAIWALDAGALAAIVLSLPPAVRAARRLRETSAPVPVDADLAEAAR